MAARKKKRATRAAAPRTVGRPTKLTAQLGRKIAQLLEKGWFLSHVAAEVGLADSTLRKWIDDGEKADAEPEAAEFSAACARARARAERKILARIERKTARWRSKAAGDWKPDQWRLAIMNPAIYREVKRTELTGADGGPVPTVASVVLFPPEEPIDGEGDRARPVETEPGPADAVPRVDGE